MQPNYRTDTVSGTRGKPAALPAAPAAASTPPPAPSKVMRSSHGLREVLFDQLDRLRKGESTVNEAKAVAAIAAQIISSVHMEIAVAEARKAYPEDPILPPPLKLNAPQG